MATNIDIVAQLRGDLLAKLKDVSGWLVDIRHNIISLKDVAATVFVGFGISKIRDELSGLLTDINDVNESINRLAKQGRRFAFDSPTFQGLAYGAKKAGVEVETLELALRLFAKNISLATNPGQILLNRAFDKIGFNAKRAIDQNKSTLQSLFEVVDGLEGLGTQFEKDEVLIEVFGRSGEKLNEFFRKGSAGLKEYLAEARKLNIAFSPEQTRNAEKATEALIAFKTAVFGLKAAISTTLAGDLTEFYLQLASFTATVPTLFVRLLDKIRLARGQFINSVPDFVGPMDPASLAARQAEAQDQVKAFFDALTRTGIEVLKQGLILITRALITGVSLVFTGVRPELVDFGKDLAGAIVEGMPAAIQKVLPKVEKSLRTRIEELRTQIAGIGQNRPGEVPPALLQPGQTLADMHKIYEDLRTRRAELIELQNTILKKIENPSASEQDQKAFIEKEKTRLRYVKRQLEDANRTIGFSFDDFIFNISSARKKGLETELENLLNELRGRQQRAGASMISDLDASLTEFEQQTKQSFEAIQDTIQPFYAKKNFVGPLSPEEQIAVQHSLANTTEALLGFNEVFKQHQLIAKTDEVPVSSLTDLYGKMTKGISSATYAVFGLIDANRYLASKNVPKLFPEVLRATGDKAAADELEARLRVEKELQRIGSGRNLNTILTTVYLKALLDTEVQGIRIGAQLKKVDEALTAGEKAYAEAIANRAAAINSGDTTARESRELERQNIIRLLDAAKKSKSEIEKVLSTVNLNPNRVEEAEKALDKVNQKIAETEGLLVSLDNVQAFDNLELATRHLTEAEREYQIQLSLRDLQFKKGRISSSEANQQTIADLLIQLDIVKEAQQAARDILRDSTTNLSEDSRRKAQDEFDQLSQTIANIQNQLADLNTATIFDPLEKATQRLTSAEAEYQAKLALRAVNVAKGNIGAFEADQQNIQDLQTLLAKATVARGAAQAILLDPSLQISEDARRKALDDFLNLTTRVEALKLQLQQLDPSLELFFTSASTGFENLIHQMADAQKAGEQMGEAIASGLTTGVTGALEEIGRGTKRVKQAFQDLAVNVLLEIASIITRLLIARALASAFGYYGPLPAANTGGKFMGRRFQRYALGGQALPGFQVPGHDTGRDTFPALLRPREWVHPVSSVDYYGDQVMAAIQRRTIPRSVLAPYTGTVSAPASKMYASGGPARGVPAQTANGSEQILALDAKFMDRLLSSSGGPVLERWIDSRRSRN